MTTWGSLLAAIVLAAPISAQAIGVGVYTDADGPRLVAEATMAADVGPFSANLLLTFDGPGEPLVQPQLGLTLANLMGAELVLDVGANAGPADYTAWEPHFAMTGVFFIVGPLLLSGTLAWQPWAKWAQSSVLKIELPL
jgi:hypothetical protein